MEMENILFVPTVRESLWIPELFSGGSPVGLPVAGRRILDYGLEIAQRANVTLVDVLDWSYDERLAKEFSDPTRTANLVFYTKGEGAMPRGLNDLDGLSSPLTQSIQEGLFVVWGPCLVLELDNFDPEPVSPEDCANTPMGLYWREGGVWKRLHMKRLTVRDVKSWHEMNFVVLHDPGWFTLPGYSAEHCVYLGRNVVMEFGTRVKAPVLLGDNTWLARNVRLEGDVIVGSGSFVNEGARLARTVVADNTYIGVGLDLEGKIVIGGRVIDVETGAWTDLEEPGLTNRLNDGFGWMKSVWRFLRGRSYGRSG